MIFVLRFLIFASVHSLCASDWVKEIFSRFSGREPRFYRLGYNLASLVMFAWVMAAYRTSPVLYFAPGIWSLVMYGAQLLVAGILFQCVRQTGAGDFLGTNQIKSARSQPPTLVTSGCYAHMRHPLYFYATLFFVLNPVMTAQWLLLTILSVVYFIVGGLIEERRLLKRFGEEYQAYLQRVPFLFPIGKRLAPSRDRGVS